MPTLDPEVARLIELGRQAARPPFEALTPQQARDAYAASWSVLQPTAVDVASIRDVAVPTDAGDLRLRIYRGVGTRADEPLPCLLFLHGGGWVMGNLESHDRLCRRLANLARICLIAVDYRLAPEHRFPAAVDDAVSALRWVVENSAGLALAPGRIGVCGDSAGGNLAAVLALMARDGSVPPVMHQALIYPVTDLAEESGSYASVPPEMPLTAPTMRYFIDHYVPVTGDRLDWRASPLRAPSLAGTAPALVVTVSNDPLCDEGRAYAERLEEEGVRVVALHLSDHIHGVLMHGKLVRASNVLVEIVAALIGEALHHGSPAGRGD